MAHFQNAAPDRGVLADRWCWRKFIPRMGLISDPGAFEIIPTGLNFRPASEAAKRGAAEF